MISEEEFTEAVKVIGDEKKKGKPRGELVEMLSGAKYTDMDIKKIMGGVYKEQAATKKKKEKEKKSKTTKQKTKTERFTRTMAAVRVFKKSGKITTAEKLAEQGNALYVKKGGEDNLGVSKRLTSYVVEILAEMNMITIESKKITKV